MSADDCAMDMDMDMEDCCEAVCVVFVSVCVRAWSID